MEDINSHTVVCFGEVLWDISPSGSVPGGAPMNVAYHLHKQQKNPAVITSVGNDESWFSKHTSIEDRVRSITDKFKIQNMVVTMGGDGAVLYYNGNEYVQKGYKVDVADTVGSGDAFLAGLLSRLLDKASPVNALEFASGLGAFIAMQKGACPVYNFDEIYKLLKTGVVP